MSRRTDAGHVIVAHSMPLDRLYARFDAIARGRAPVDSSAAQRSVIERLQSNQHRAEALGWTAFVLERAGGRLELRGTSPTGRSHEIVPDAIPYDAHNPDAASDLTKRSDDRIETDVANLTLRAGKRWLDDSPR